MIQPYSLLNIWETSSSKTETSKQILLYGTFIWPLKHRETILEQLILWIKAEEKKEKKFCIQGWMLQHYFMGEIKIKCKTISTRKERCYEKYIM